MHLQVFVPGLMRGVSDGIDKWLTHSNTRSVSASIMLTDSLPVAAEAEKSNDIVILVHENYWALKGGVQTAVPTSEGVSEAVFQGFHHRSLRKTA